MKNKLFLLVLPVMCVSTHIVINSSALAGNTVKADFVQLPLLNTQFPLQAGPVLKGGVVDMKATEDYRTISTRDFDPAGVETITQHNLVGRYKNAVILDIPPRHMWGWGGSFTGYCGETSLQMCGLYFGNYVSQEIVRYAANSNDTQLLIGVNDVTAAQALQYTYDTYQGATIDQFISWVKNHIDQGHPVIVGWYQHHKPDEKADPDYDHIMPIVGYSFDTKNQVNGFYFYDLYLKNYSLIQAPTYKDFKKTAFKTRQQTHSLASYKLPGINGLAINPNSPDLPSFAAGKDNQTGYEICAYTYAIPRAQQYALAITGANNQANQPLIRTKLVIDKWKEPNWGMEENKNEAPVAFNAYVVVYDVIPAQTYTLFRFEANVDTQNHVINSGSIFKSYTQKIVFTAQGSTAKINVGPLQSNKAYFFRTLKGQF